MIHSCKCQHEYQDRLYGKGNRVMNQTDKPTTVRCTVCKTERGVSAIPKSFDK